MPANRLALATNSHFLKSSKGKKPDNRKQSMKAMKNKGPQGFILKSKSRQWAWELFIDGELHQAGAGYESQGDAIDGLMESNGHIEGINLVLSQEAGQ